jgi:hypothetical protein
MKPRLTEDQMRSQKDKFIAMGGEIKISEGDDGHVIELWTLQGKKKRGIF